MSKAQLSKVISRGQTGVDRAALEVALFLEIPHGGWCPKGRRAEDGPIPETFDLIETSSFNYTCLLYTSPSPRDQRGSRMPSSA